MRPPPGFKYVGLTHPQRFVEEQTGAVRSTCRAHKSDAFDITLYNHYTWVLQRCPRTLPCSHHALHTLLHPSHVYNRCTLTFHGRSTQTLHLTTHTSIGGSARWKSSSPVGGRRKLRTLRRKRRRIHKMSTPRAGATSSCSARVERSWTDFGTTASGNHSDWLPPSCVSFSFSCPRQKLIATY